LYHECPDCLQVLEESEFYIHIRTATGERKRTVRCKICESIRKANNLEHHVSEHFNSTRRRSVAKGIRFELTKEWFREKLEGDCELSGLPFDFQSKTRKQSARAASIDRIDPAGGYTVENSRLICKSLNFLLGSWGEPQSMAVIIAYLRRKGFRVENDKSS